MSFLKFLWNACWREADKVTRSVQIVAVTLPFLATVVIGILGGKWSRELWPAWVWGALTLTAILLSIIYGIFRRAYNLEKALVPRITVSDPIEAVFPKVSKGKAKRSYSIFIRNDSHGNIQ